MVMWRCQLELHFIELSHFGAIYEVGELGDENFFYFQRPGRTKNYFKGAREQIFYFIFQVTLRYPDFFSGLAFTVNMRVWMGGKGRGGGTKNR